MHIKRNILLVIMSAIILFFACKTTQKPTVVNNTKTAMPSDSIPPSPTADTAATQAKTTVAIPAPLSIHKKDNSRTDAFLENLLRQYPQYFNAILNKRDDFKVQIIYTQINRDANNIPAFKDYYFHVDSNNYFYPASTVKMPTALLALQRLNELKIAGLNRNTTMITGSDYSGQTAVYNDPTTANGGPTIEQYIKKIFLVSDNDAFNRLYEFLGQRYTNEQLHLKGYKDVQINHRLDIFLSEEENRHTNPVQFRNAEEKIIYDQPMQYNTIPYLKRKDLLGKGYYKNEVLINEPMNFSIKNRISLADLHQIVRSIMFPQSVAAWQRFNITPEEYQFVRQYMSQLPQETIYPPYDSAYQDAFCKYLLLGADKNARLPKDVRIFNKIGDAYGFLIDAAYIADFDNQVEFMLSAVIYCNEDDIVNNDTHEFETVGFPFMKHLGEVIYQHELKRNRKHTPDLGEFKMSYDKPR